MEIFRKIQVRSLVLDAFCLAVGNLVTCGIFCFRSWFIGNSVSSEGTILLSTKIDPLFLILPLLQQVCTFFSIKSFTAF